MVSQIQRADFWAGREYDITIPANQYHRLDVVGDFFKVIRATGLLRVTLDTGPQLSCEPGQGLRRRPFSRLDLVDLSGADNTVRLFCGSDDLIDDRLVGELRAQSQSYGDQAFSCWVQGGVVPPLQQSWIELWNPANSGKRVVLDRWRLAAGAAPIEVLSGYYNAAIGVSPGQGASHRARQLTATLSKAEVRSTQAVAGTYPFLSGVAVFDDYAPAQAYAENVPPSPIILDPGFGYLWNGQSAANGIQMTIDWHEEPNL